LILHVAIFLLYSSALVQLIHSICGLAGHVAHMLACSGTLFCFKASNLPDLMHILAIEVSVLRAHMRGTACHHTYDTT